MINLPFLIYFRQGRLEDFKQTLMNEYVDFTTSAPAFSGINIKIKQEPKNIFGKFFFLNKMKSKYHKEQF